MDDQYTPVISEEEPPAGHSGRSSASKSSRHAAAGNSCSSCLSPDSHWSW